MPSSYAESATEKSMCSAVDKITRMEQDSLGVVHTL